MFSSSSSSGAWLELLLQLQQLLLEALDLDAAAQKTRHTGGSGCSTTAS
jgi:hypothetical protein